MFTKLMRRIARNGFKVYGHCDPNPNGYGHCY